MTRHEAREIAFCMVFECSFHEVGYCEELVSQAIDKNEILSKYTINCVLGVFGNLEAVDAYITKYTKGWNNDRISRVSMAILRLAIFEMCIGQTVGYAIAINEAVEIAKKFDGDGGPAFVNGILGSIARGTPDEDIPSIDDYSNETLTQTLDEAIDESTDEVEDEVEDEVADEKV